MVPRARVRSTRWVSVGIGPLRHQLEPLVIGAGAGADCVGVDGGFSELGELDGPPPWPLVPPVAVVPLVDPA